MDLKAYADKWSCCQKISSELFITFIALKEKKKKKYIYIIKAALKSTITLGGQEKRKEEITEK